MADHVSRRSLTRRGALRSLAATAVIPVLAACQQAPQVVEKVVTQVVEKQVTQVVEKVVTQVVEKVVQAPTATAVPAPRANTPVPKLRIGISNQINLLDITKGSLHVNEFNTNILTSGQLYRFDFEQKPYFDLLEKSDVSADGLTVRMTLKPNLKYSDGTPLKADDGLLAYERLQKMEGKGFFTPVNSLTAPDDRTLEWKLKAPYSELPRVLAFQYMIFHPRSKMESDPNYWRKPVSAGPYVIKEWTPGTNRLLLEANPNYVGGQMMAGQLELITVSDLTSRVLQLSTGALDFAFEIPFSSQGSLPKEVQAIPHPQGGMFHVTINTTTGAEPLRDAKVRRAMSLAIDRKAVSEKAFFGVSAAAEAMMFKNVSEWSPTLPNGAKQDLEGAKKLLGETQWAKGFDFQFLTWSARTGWKEAALLIAEEWKKIGINAKVEPVEDAVVVARAGDRKFDAMWTGTVQAPVTMFKIVYVPGSIWADASGFKDAKVAEMLDKAQVEPDAGKRKELITEIEKITLEAMPHIPVCERALLLGSRVPNTLFGVVRHQNYLRVAPVSEIKA